MPAAKRPASETTDDIDVKEEYGTKRGKGDKGKIIKKVRCSVQCGLIFALPGCRLPPLGA